MMFRRQTLVLATHNPDKQAEMNAVLSDLGLDVIGLDQYPEIDDIPENGTTLLENALIKARAVHLKTGFPALADDTGLEVDALHGAPGVYSARFAGEDATYQDNVKKLLSVMAGVSKQNRTARFRTVVALIDSDTELWTEGIIEGLIIREQRGAGGFGYDPIFEAADTGKTFSEMSAAQKNEISHRARALQKMRKKLITVFEEKGE
ncbi:MAG: RdgB/HAM1 family non-canonical purine NTP pyrophosphatase [Candidatus Neomarinimicrobiota bacterium]|nr:RdgB/HAM1 family non-canonical purine NTP pyrophosphatase [Candidatus Neomarinimicrobiota bacterium]